MTASHTLHDCYNAIIRAAKANPNNRLIDYAAAYAREGLRMPDALTKSELTSESRVQAVYVRANLSGWRGDEAKAIRLALDKITGAK
ncbi:hypothetical protein EVC02_072 [Rhizobium phage RHph_N17]|nr:hypothetical protein EVC02_072 [Rhizobium phage RHph_N17]